MKVLSLWQPWATLMAIGAKTIETRSWYTPHRGPLAIAATATYPKGIDVYFYQFAKVLERAGYPDHHSLPLGSVLCVVDVIACKPTETIAPSFFDGIERAAGDYSPGRFGWITTHLRRLPKPMPFKGGQGLTREVNDGLLATYLAPAPAATA